MTDICFSTDSALTDRKHAVDCMQITDMRCCLFINPIGLHSRRPEFSWELVHAGDGNSAQAAWRIIVGKSLAEVSAGVGSLWDSGWNQESRSTFIRYGGAALGSGLKYYWRVYVRDAGGGETGSDVVWWTSGLFDETDWSAHWIGKDGPPEYPEAPFTGASWIWASDAVPGEVIFEKTFTCSCATPAQLWGLADDEAAVEINGEPVCELLRAQANSNLFPLPLPIDINLNEGLNHIRVTARKRDLRDNHAGLILRVRTEDGTCIVTDEGWSCLSNGTPAALRVLGSFGIAPWDQQSVREYPNLPARYLRREFNANTEIRGAVLYYSGLGLSQVWINGTRIGDEVLSPHVTDYDSAFFYRAFDVSALIRSGLNAVGCVLGNGRFFAPRDRVPLPMVTYGNPRLRFQLHIEYADGSSEKVVSDEAWRVCCDGPIGWNNEFDGETYDGRKEMPGWNLPGWDADGWEFAELVAAPGGVSCGQTSDPIRVTECVAPVSCRRTQYGTFIYDFGRNMVGWVRVALTGQASTRVLLRHAEYLDSADTLATENLRSALCTDTVILGDGITCYEPTFVYHGFRYVEIRGEVQVQSIEACFVHDAVECSGQFLCSDDRVNQLVEAAKSGIRSNYRSMPTDCPQRDERMGWLGDRAGGAPNEMFLFDVCKLYRKWMDDIRLSQAPSGCIPDVSPPFWRIYSDNVTWPSSMVLIPYWLYRHYGDIGTVRRNYSAMSQWIEHVCRYRVNGLVTRDCYGDWCVPPEEPHLIHSQCDLRKTNPVLLSSCYLALCLTLASALAHALGKAEDALCWIGIRDEIKDALNDRFFNERTGYYDNGAQTANLLPLAFGLVPVAERERVFAHLVQKLTETGSPVLGTGLVGGHWLLRTLTAFGRADIAKELVCREEYPSWGYMLRQGATTIWELWNGNTADPLMNSGNHVMLLGDVLTWLFEDVAGIHPLEPGFKSVLLRPHFTFDWVKCWHRSIHGVISSNWETDGNVVKWEIGIPANVTGRVELPAGCGDTLRYDDGRTQLPPVQRLACGKSVLEIGSGSHVFAFSRIK